VNTVPLGRRKLDISDKVQGLGFDAGLFPHFALRCPVRGLAWFDMSFGKHPFVRGRASPNEHDLPAVGRIPIDDTASVRPVVVIAIQRRRHDSGRLPVPYRRVHNQLLDLMIVDTVMPHHIGIVACSAEGAALCYRTICVEGAQLLGAHAHPEVSMHTHALADYMKCIYRGDWLAAGELMLSSANKLANIGADFLICPDNTLHQALPHVEPRSPLPWLHIADVVAGQAVERGFRRVGLTGTRWLVESEIYPERLAARGVEYVRSNAAERELINRIIMDELVNGLFRPEAVTCFQHVIERMKGEGCDAVVLGCTEIPLLMNDANSPLPTLDSTRLLARAALRRAVMGTARPS
jgi:aspartate racemase